MYLITTDLHLTDRDDDAYRWDIFPFLKKQAKKHKSEHIFILGDLTDFKDNHSARLVNRIVEEVVGLTDYCEVTILKGNHDYVDPKTPFFGFMDGMSLDPYGHEQRVNFVSVIWDVVVRGKHLLLLPHTRTPKEDWKGLDFNKADYIMCHQTFKGALASNGREMDAEISAKILGEAAKKSYAGDIHVPQTLGGVCYIGSPFRIRFGDSYTPRVLCISETGKRSDLHLKTVQKHTLYIDSPEELVAYPGVNKGDQVKIRFRLDREFSHEWQSTRKEIIVQCESLGFKIHAIEAIVSESGKKKKNKTQAQARTGVSEVVTRSSSLSKQELFESFCDTEHVSAYDRDTGEALIKQVGDEC